MSEQPMTYDEAMEALRRGHLTDFLRDKVADAIEAEFARREAIADRNRERYVQLQEVARTVRADRDIYRRRAEQCGAEVARLTGETSRAPSPGNPFTRPFP